MLPALKLIKEEDMPTSSDDQSLWSQLLSIAINYVQVTETVLPVLTYVRKWAQVRSINRQVTLSLILSQKFKKILKLSMLQQLNLLGVAVVHQLWT